MLVCFEAKARISKWHSPKMCSVILQLCRVGKQATVNPDIFVVDLFSLGREKTKIKKLLTENNAPINN